MARTSIGGDPCFDYKQMKIYTAAEKGILQFGVSTTLKGANTRKAYDVTANKLINDAQLQQQFETFIAKKRDRELQKIKEKLQGIEQKAEASDSDSDKVVRTLNKRQVVAAEKKNKEENMIYEIQQDQRRIEKFCNFRKTPKVKFET